MTKIIFVCFGNICRSPMAEFVMKNLVARAGLEKDFQIESAGTHPSIGTPLSNGTAHELIKNNVPFTRRTSVQLNSWDYKHFDYLIGLDRSNIRDMRDICGGDPDKKMSLLMDWAGKTGKEIEDPWNTGDFDGILKQLEQGCAGIIQSLRRLLYTN